MEALTNFLKTVNGLVWGPPMLVLLGLGGLFLMIGLGFRPLQKLPYAARLLFRKGDEDGAEGDISPFKSLMTAMAAAVGTGNIAGVATAIVSGGPGALFYMWLIALLGMATSYSEAFCAVKYRVFDDTKRAAGGPMYYIKKGVGEKFPLLATILGTLFAIFAAIAAFGIGNGVQANSVAAALEANFGFSNMITGIVLMVLTGAVILGGVKRIGDIAGAVVPTMVIAYLLCGIIVILMNLGSVPAAFGLIFSQAFSSDAAVGGFAGAGVAAAVRFGVARGVFSNEAGLGSAPIAHAAAKTNDPVKQGHIAMLGTCIDT
ncbi:MAG: amino acid carrier protein, partial [Verrucomicrobiota bacterium]